jgi:hypothetical protein
VTDSQSLLTKLLGTVPGTASARGTDTLNSLKPLFGWNPHHDREVEHGWEVGVFSLVVLVGLV